MIKYKYWLLPVLWMGVIYYSSATPYEEQDIKPFLSDTIDLSFLVPLFDWITFQYHNSEVSVSVLGIEGFIEFFVRKGAHVTVYFILFSLFFLAIKKTLSVSLSKTLVFSMVFTSMYAILDEFHQGFTQNRTPYIGDVGLDLFGAAMAMAFIILICTWKRKRKSVS
ncbi:VanZ family protein [Virgibacillus sp. DJP39]|uniref:VanZ family protein n=1 Tax=Virgibacillus sp. DJP39 TaxID=3409790 RepID=UPI003BB4B0A1